MSLSVIPVTSEKKDASFDLFAALNGALEKNQLKLQDGDVIVISTKYVANSQGRVLDLEKIHVTKKGMDVSKKFQLKPEIAEIVIRESDKIFGGMPGFLITSSDDIMAPNAGIDKSNAKTGRVILYPKNPFDVAENLRRNIFLNFHIHVGVILVDSRLMPARIGTTGVAVACAGIEPVLDMRGRKDLEGNPLKVTFQAVADNLATIANHKMGEGSESRPFAIIRNSDTKMTDRRISPKETAVATEQCVYVRGLSNPMHE